MSGIIHPGGGGAAAAAQPAAAPSAPVTPQTAQRMRVGDMVMLHQQPPPQLDAIETVPDYEPAPVPTENLDAQSQAIAVPDEPQVLDAQIEVDGQPVTWEQYQALQAKWNQEDLHDELMSKFVVAKIDGQPYKIPVSEAVQGYQRSRDYSNAMAAVAQERRELAQTRQGFQNMLADMDRGDTFMRMIRALGKEEGFKQAAKQYAVEYHYEKQMTPQQRELLYRHRELERKAYQLEARNRQLEQAAQQHQAPSQREQYQEHQLRQMIPLASQRVGLPDSPLARQAFALHWQQMMAGKPADFELTTDFVVQVMSAAKEEVDAAVARSEAERARLAPKNPPIQRLPGAAPTAQQVQQNGQPRRMRVSDMNTQLTRLPGR